MNKYFFLYIFSVYSVQILHDAFECHIKQQSRTDRVKITGLVQKRYYNNRLSCGFSCMRFTLKKIHGRPSYSVIAERNFEAMTLDIVQKHYARAHGIERVRYDVLSRNNRTIDFFLCFQYTIGYRLNYHRLKTSI